jgi:hypothetical protein
MINWIIMNFFACGELSSAEGRNIPTIRLTCPLVPLRIA